MFSNALTKKIPTTVLLKQCCACKSPGVYEKADNCSAGLGKSLRSCLSNKLSADAVSLGPRTTL